MVNSRETLAFSVDRVRERLWTNVAVPPDLLQKTFRELDAQLTAKTTKHFAFQGQVVDERTVADNGARLGAIDKVLSIAGAYVRERDQRPPSTAVALEIDPVTGIYRIVVGVGVGQAAPPPEKEVHNEVVQSLEIASSSGMTPAALATGMAETEPTPQRIRVPRGPGRTPPEILKLLFAEDE